MLKEIRCSMCNGFYNNSERIPIALNNCTHNVCQACFISNNEGGKCPYDGKPFSFDKIMINKQLLELINYLMDKNMLKEEPDETEEQLKYKKEKEDKINFKIELLGEFITVIKTNFFFEDKVQYINNLEKNLKETYEEKKVELENLFNNCENKMQNTKNHQKKFETNLQKSYLEYNLNLIENFKKELSDITLKHEAWIIKISYFMDEITNDIDNIVNNFNSYSEEIDDKIKECERLSTDINLFNESFTKLKLKIRNVQISISENGIIQITIDESINRINHNRNKSTNPSNSDAKKLITSNKKEQKNSNLNSFCIENNHQELFGDDNLLTKDIDLNSNKNNNDDYLLIPDTNTQASTKNQSENGGIDNMSGNNNGKELNESFDDSFLATAESLGLNDKKVVQKKLTKDCIVFIKNKLRSDSINCSGYDIGDEGVKKLLEFMIKKNLELKVGNTLARKGQMKYKELKLSRCNLTNDALNYIKSIMEVCKNTITHINLSRNYIDVNGVSILCSILQKNPQLKDLKLSKNNIPTNGKEIIEACIKLNNLNVKLEM